MLLHALEEMPNVSRACRMAGISRVHAYRVKNDDEEFAEAWGVAIDIGLAGLEESCFKRARDGVTERRYKDGEVVYERVVYSDTLAIFMLKAHKPDVYTEKSRIEHSGQVGGLGEFLSGLPDVPEDEEADECSAPS